MLGQHTAKTGQNFEPAAVDRVHVQTAEQPWLVNALCDQACFKDPPWRNRSRSITADAILAVREVLIQVRAVHRDQLADKLQQERVQRVVEPVLRGAVGFDFYRHDYECMRDLGLSARQDEIRIANPIYAEVIPHDLTFVAQKCLASRPRGT